MACEDGLNQNTVGKLGLQVRLPLLSRHLLSVMMLTLILDSAVHDIIRYIKYVMINVHSAQQTALSPELSYEAKPNGESVSWQVYKATVTGRLTR